MSGPGEPAPGGRVRVTGPPRRAAPRPRTGDIDDETPLGAVYVGSLLREQLALGVRVVVVLAVSVAGLPLLFHLVPALVDVEVLGLPLPWVLLGGLVYPWLVLLGWHYVRRAERNERDFASLLEDLDG